MAAEKVLQRVPYKQIVTTTGELADLGEPLRIWTPDGGYTAKFHVDVEKMPVKTTYTDIVLQARQREPAQRPVTSGEWDQIRKRLQETEPDIEKSMVTGPLERTSTFLDYEHGTKRKNWYDGLFIQLPDVDEDGNMVTDESGILKARDIWEMALPISTDYVRNFPPELTPFFNTIYAEEEVRGQLPDYAYFWATPEALRNVVRGLWGWHSPESRRVRVIGNWRPLTPSEGVASRVASENV